MVLQRTQQHSQLKYNKTQLQCILYKTSTGEQVGQFLFWFTVYFEGHQYLSWTTYWLDSYWTSCLTTETNNRQIEMEQDWYEMWEWVHSRERLTVNEWKIDKNDVLKRENDRNRKWVLTEEQEVDESVTDFHVGSSDGLPLPLLHRQTRNYSLL